MKQVFSWLNKNYPQNYILQKPVTGTLVFIVYCFCFVILYKPLSVHQARLFSFGITMAMYLGALSVPVFLMISLLKKIKYFSDPVEWTVLKELLSIFLILLGMGIAVYFMGFLMESPGKRWNLETLLDSCTHTFLVGMIPFLFFTVMNYRHLFIADIVRDYDPEITLSHPEQQEKPIRIESQLKKEELSFLPSQLLYLESDGNYVVFHLFVDNQARKQIIRNSITNIEKQLSTIPFLMRTHRAFIVNVKQVSSQKGNTLGYRLKLNGTESQVPVSRQNTRDFDLLLRQYR